MAKILMFPLVRTKGPKSVSWMAYISRSQITKITGKDLIKLYRDDGLAVSSTNSGPIRADSLRKRYVKVFQKNQLKITVETNLVKTVFLDIINLNLNRGKYWPYRKPCDDPICIDSHSNHPPNITKHLPHMIASRISNNACKDEEFQKASPLYHYELKNIDFDIPVVYQPP